MQKIIHVVSNPSYRDVANAACELYLAISEFYPKIEQAFIQMQPGALGYPEVPASVGGFKAVKSLAHSQSVILLHSTPTLNANFTSDWHEVCPVVLVKSGISKSIIDHRYRCTDAIIATCDGVKNSIRQFAKEIRIEQIQPVARQGSNLAQMVDSLLCGRFVSRFAKYSNDWLKWCSEVDLPVPLIYENIGLGQNITGKANVVKTLSESLFAVERLETIRRWSFCLHESGAGEGINWGIVECLSNGIPVLCNSSSESSCLIREGVNGYCFSNREESLSFMTDFCLDPNLLNDLRESCQKCHNIQLERYYTAKRYVDLFSEIITGR